MSMVLESVKRTAQLYWTNEQRHYYTTPKSYLESISLYSELLRSKMKETRETIRRLENGLVKLSQCAELVQELKVCDGYLLGSFATFKNALENAWSTRDYNGRKACSRRSANCGCRR